MPILIRDHNIKYVTPRHPATTQTGCPSHVTATPYSMSAGYHYFCLVHGLR